MFILIPYRVVGKFKAVEKNMCAKMFPSIEHEGGEAELSDSEDISESKLAEYRDLYYEKFRYPT